MEKHRSLRPVSEDRYNALVSLTTGTFKVPIKNRTMEQKRAILQFSRARDQFSVRDGVLYRLNREVLKSRNIPALIDKTFNEMEGCGSRPIKNRIQTRYTGISQSRILRHLTKNKDYSKLYAKFTNKVPMRSVTATRVGERWQIDLVDMKSEEIEWNGSAYRYILTIIDVFSRYLITRPLKKKESKEVAKELKGIFVEHGTPKILQCDNGTEFKGSMSALARKCGIKVIRGRPYHPQSQGKCERSHRLLRRKLNFMANKGGASNWVKVLPKATQSINTTSKEVLSYKTPFEIYFGRNHDGKCDTIEGSCRLRSNVMKSSDRCANRNRRYISKSTGQPAVYEIGENVLARYPFSKSRIPRKRYVLTAKILEKKLNSYKYKIEYNDPKTGEKSTSWVSVENLTSCLINSGKSLESNNIVNDNPRSVPSNPHKERFYIPITKTDHLQNLKNMSVHILYDPPGDGSCQFQAISDQLSRVGIFRTHLMLRNNAVDHLQKNQLLYEPFNAGNFNRYIHSMRKPHTFGDNLTLLALSREFNMQIMVMSTRGLLHSTIVSIDGSFYPDIYTITLGYFPEGQGDHYVSIQVNRQTFESIVIQYCDNEQGQIGSSKEEESSTNRDTDSTLNRENLEEGESNNDRDTDSGLNRENLEEGKSYNDLDTDITLNRDNLEEEQESYYDRDIDSPLNRDNQEEEESYYDRDTDSRLNRENLEDGKSYNDMDTDSTLNRDNLEEEGSYYDRDTDSPLNRDNLKEESYYDRDTDSSLNRDNQEEEESYYDRDTDSTLSCENREKGESNSTLNRDNLKEEESYYDRDTDSSLNRDNQEEEESYYDRDTDSTLSCENREKGESNSTLIRENLEEGESYNDRDTDSTLNRENLEGESYNDRDTDTTLNRDNLEEEESYYDRDTDSALNRENLEEGESYNDRDTDSTPNRENLEGESYNDRDTDIRLDSTLNRENLPKELQAMIIKFAIASEPCCRFTLRKVNRFFRQVISKLPPIQIHISPSVAIVLPNPVSVRRLAKLAGTHSGLVQEVKKIIKSKNWFNAWLYITMSNAPGWFIVYGLWYRKPIGQ